jgi:NADPH2:quinone reductase
VGHVAIQIALAHGAKVYATGSGDSLDVIRSLGAEVIDYTTTSTEDYVQATTAGAGFDVVLDTVGGATLDSSFLAVRRHTGRVVSVLGWGSHDLAPLSFRGASYTGVFTLLPLLTGEGRAHHGQILTQIALLVDEGLITPRVDQARYGLHDIAEAHDSVAVTANSGKVVVDVQPTG